MSRPDLLDRALKLDPDNDKVLALSGSAAFERKDYKAAIRHWEALLKHPGVSGELAQALQCRNRRGTGRCQTGKKTVEAAGRGRVSGTVTLDAALTGKGGAGGYGFRVRARRTRGRACRWQS